MQFSLKGIYILVMLGIQYVSVINATSMDSIFVAHCQWCRFLEYLLLNKLSWISQRSERWSDVIWINNRHACIPNCDSLTLSFNYEVMRFSIRVFPTSQIMWLERRCCCSTILEQRKCSFVILGSGKCNCKLVELQSYSLTPENDLLTLSTVPLLSQIFWKSLDSALQICQFW